MESPEPTTAVSPSPLHGQPLVKTPPRGPSPEMIAAMRRAAQRSAAAMLNERDAFVIGASKWSNGRSYGRIPATVKAWDDFIINDLAKPAFVASRDLNLAVLTRNFIATKAAHIPSDAITSEIVGTPDFRKLCEESIRGNVSDFITLPAQVISHAEI